MALMFLFADPTILMDDLAQGRATPRRWTPDEDAALREAVQTLGDRRWKLIAACVPGRDHVQCLQRWRKALAPGLRKGHWDAAEDEALLEQLRLNPHNWGEVAAAIPGRTPKQCRERWANHLDPSIRKCTWTSEEDELLTVAILEHGPRWAKISRMIPGRTENAVKVRAKALAKETPGIFPFLDDSPRSTSTAESILAEPAPQPAVVGKMSVHPLLPIRAREEKEDLTLVDTPESPGDEILASAPSPRLDLVRDSAVLPLVENTPMPRPFVQPVSSHGLPSFSRSLQGAIAAPSICTGFAPPVAPTMSVMPSQPYWPGYTPSYPPTMAGWPPASPLLMWRLPPENPSRSLPSSSH
jgi:hypothetical protein